MNRRATAAPTSIVITEVKSWIFEAEREASFHFMLLIQQLSGPGASFGTLGASRSYRSESEMVIGLTTNARGIVPISGTMVVKHDDHTNFRVTGEGCSITLTDREVTFSYDAAEKIYILQVHYLASGFVQEMKLFLNLVVGEFTEKT